MSPDGESLADWLASPPGQLLLSWEAGAFDDAVGDIFGYHALQLGCEQLDALRLNRMPHQWLAVTSPPVGRSSAAFAQAEGAVSPHVALVAAPEALPFSAASLDLLVLPHTLELSQEPHAALREAERVLVPEGRIVITGINPNSFWGFRQSRLRLYRHIRQRFGPESQRDFSVQSGADLSMDSACSIGSMGSMGSIGYGRLRDWLQLLGFEVESTRFGVYVPALANQAWLQRLAWMNPLGARWWPIFGAVYCVVAVKRVRGMRLLEPARRPRKAVATATAGVARKDVTLQRGSDH